MYSLMTSVRRAFLRQVTPCPVPSRHGHRFISAVDAPLSIASDLQADAAIRHSQLELHDGLEVTTGLAKGERHVLNSSNTSLASPTLTFCFRLPGRRQMGSSQGPSGLHDCAKSRGGATSPSLLR